MKKGQIALVISIVLAVFSSILLKVMYIIDPITEYGGFITAFCFIFVNVPIWIISLFLFVYSMVILIKNKLKKNKGITEEGEII